VEVDRKLRRIAHEIALVRELGQHVYAYAADHEYVTVAVDYIDTDNVRTLDHYFPILKERRDMIMNPTISMDAVSEEESKNIQSHEPEHRPLIRSRADGLERGLLYLCSIHPIITGLLRAIHKLHDNDIFYANLRPSTIRINDIDSSPIRNGRDKWPSDDELVELIDYRDAILARNEDRPSRKHFLSPSNKMNDEWYYSVNTPLAIEREGRIKYSKSSEMWSIGMILLSLWTCKPPFTDFSHEKVILFAFFSASPCVLMKLFSGCVCSIFIVDEDVSIATIVSIIYRTIITGGYTSTICIPNTLVLSP
jgi:serine/threonine protein kinase